MMRRPARTTLLAAGLAAACVVPVAAQEAGGTWQPKLEIPWNRYYRHAELNAWMERMRDTWPGFVELREIGRSYEGRPMVLMALTNQATGAADDKVAMWVDGNVHGNEVQGGEAALYLAWWLLEHYETNERARKLLDERAFYILPSQNPDGRDHWFDAPNTASSSRSGKRPYDNDRDGLVDEDGYDDLDGDGEIGMMRKRVPLGEGTHYQDPDDPRILLPVRGTDKQGDWLLLGSEGIDNDGDGRINEDGPGGYDMNRNWPSDWQPPHIQYGAGDYPLCFPETRAIADFLLAHPNVAAAQSFHNSGGMILRGPGQESIGPYPAADVAAYDELGEEGELMLPFYRYMILWQDLYPVHGGFVNWVYEGLGVFSFSNELWASPQYFGGTRERTGENWYATNRRNQLDWNDSVMLGDVWIDWHEVEHPLYGTIEIGGFKRQHGRVAPSFMIEEMLHRNAMFCARHAEEMPRVEIVSATAEDLGGGLRRVVAVLENKAVLPSRSAWAARNHIGRPDLVVLEGDGVQVLAGGRLADRFRPQRFAMADSEPHRLLLEEGVPGRGRVRCQWIVRGGGTLRVRYQAEKADDRSAEVTAADQVGG
ncbi:MAG: peptidase M14 [Planctomycetota bacterium]|nr:MAG: peptidase M14 [Planctomycetota bacterium]